MKKLKFIILLVLICSVFSACQKPNPETLDEKTFLGTQTGNGIHTWWHWLEGAITKEGITKDLESMKKQGVTQATILNVGLFDGKNFGVPVIDFDSPQWYEMFKWALTEAKRLGITIGAHNCDGWSSSGGPWIKPENAMKEFVWNKTLLQGGKEVNMQITRPHANLGFYQDVAVIAYKSIQTQNSFSKSNPKITIQDSIDGAILMDGCPVSSVKARKGTKIDIQFDQEFETTKLIFRQKKKFLWDDMNKVSVNYVLSASNNGKNYSKIKEFEIKGLNKNNEIVFPKISAKYFKLEIISLNDPNPWLEFSIPEFALLKENEQANFDPSIPFIEGKTASVKMNSKKDFDSIAGDLKLIDPKAILDISQNMDAKGHLKWQAPEGNWTIIRFGYTLTGAKNSPATAKGVGLEADKMDSSAITFHFNSFPKKLIDAAGDMTGNTFKFLLIDSWECEFQNWTNAMPKEFEKRRGYSLINWLPVLCGEVISSGIESEAFLHDFRLTIADLIQDNYYKHFMNLCHKNKMEFHAEVIYGGGGYPPLDVMKSNSYADMPMFEFWAGNNSNSFTEYSAQARNSLEYPHNAAIFYDKSIVGAESYTAMVHYSESPQNLKPFGDRAFSSGVNQIILHSYVHQPHEDKPGMTLGEFASHFNRNNLIWNQSAEWLDFQIRIQNVLQKGSVRNDVLFFQGDQLPQFIDNEYLNELPLGYNANICNYDILANKLTVNQSKIEYSGKTSFRLLCLPKSKSMELKTLKLIEKLVNSGAVIYGQKPEKTVSLKNFKQNNAELQELASKIWGKVDGKTVTENNFGKGKVIWGKPLKSVLQDLKLNPDFTTGNDSLNFLFFHKKIGESEVFFVANQTSKTIDANCLFRVAGLEPKVWDAENKCIIPCEYAQEGDDRTRVHYSFLPYKSVFFVFKKSSGSKANVYKYPKADTLQISEINASISFVSSSKNSVNENLNTLDWITNSTLPHIKYFSGKVLYKITFNLDKNSINKNDSVLFNLGNFDALAELKLNGKDLGVLWSPSQYPNVSGLLKENNVLEVTVSTCYRNRFIGDFSEYGKLQNVWTSAEIHTQLDKNKPLKPSGMQGNFCFIK